MQSILKYKKLFSGSIIKYELNFPMKLKRVRLLIRRFYDIIANLSQNQVLNTVKTRPQITGPSFCLHLQILTNKLLSIWHSGLNFNQK